MKVLVSKCLLVAIAFGFSDFGIVACAIAGIGNAISVHCTLLPYLPTSGELKTKPSQHSVNVLRSYGIQPEILVCRTTKPIPKTEKEKLALFCSVPKEAVSR